MLIRILSWIFLWNPTRQFVSNLTFEVYGTWLGSSFDTVGIFRRIQIPYFPNIDYRSFKNVESGLRRQNLPNSAVSVIDAFEFRNKPWKYKSLYVLWYTIYKHMQCTCSTYGTALQFRNMANCICAFASCARMDGRKKPSNFSARAPVRIMKTWPWLYS